MSRPPTIYGRARTIVGYPGEYNSGIGLPGAGSIWQTLTRYDKIGRPLFTRDGKPINYPVFFNFNQIIWQAPVIQTIGTGTSTGTAVGDAFNLAATCGPLIPDGVSHGLIQFTGTIAAPAGVVNCNCHLVVTLQPVDNTHNFINIGDDLGNNYLNIIPGSSSPGSYDFPFATVAGAALITILIQCAVFNNNLGIHQADSIAYNGVLTPAS